MSNKFLGVGGRYKDKAKALNVDEFGNVAPQSRVASKKINNETLVIKPNKAVDIMNITSFGLYTIAGRLESGNKSISLEVSDYIVGSNAEVKNIIVPVFGNRFTTDVIMAKSDKVRIKVKNDENVDLIISDLFINSASRYPKSGEINERRRRFNPPIVLAPNKTEVINLECFKTTVLGGRISEKTDLEISFGSRILGNMIEEHREWVKAYTSERRFVTDPFSPYTKECVIYIKNIGDSDVDLTDLFYYSVATNSSSGFLEVEDNEGNNIPITAEKDDDGKGVLRIVDAAPHAYDEWNNVIRTIDLSERDVPETIELAFDNDDLDGERFLKINLNGNKTLLKGRKGFILYKNLSDGHKIYHEYRIGGSGPFEREYIVEDGEGSDSNQTVKQELPNDFFPLVNFSGTSYESPNNLVIEAPNDTDLKNLRAYLVVI